MKWFAHSAYPKAVLSIQLYFLALVLSHPILRQINLIQSSAHRIGDLAQNNIIISSNWNGPGNVMTPIKTLGHQCGCP